MNKVERCEKFLKANGWIQQNNDYDEADFITYNKDDSVSVDINDEEIVFVSDIGDILHLPCNYYALVGALMELRQICIAYISIQPIEF